MADNVEYLQQEIERLRLSIGLINDRISGIDDRMKQLESSPVLDFNKLNLDKWEPISPLLGQQEQPIQSDAHSTNKQDNSYDQFDENHLSGVSKDTDTEKTASKAYSQNEKIEGQNEQRNRNDSGRAESDLELKIGSNWLNRIGIVAIILGMGFFLKYAFDNQWIGEIGRVVIGILVGMTLIVAGERYQKKAYKLFAQGLSGGGVAVLYLSIFAAHSLYGLIPFSVAIIFELLVVTLSVAQSLRYDTAAITTLGFFGGYMAPYILSSGQSVGDSPLSLFVYTIALSLGIVVLAVFKRWSFLVIMGAFFGYLGGITWSVQNNINLDYWLVVGYFTAVYIVFSFAEIAFSVYQKMTASKAMTVLTLFNGAIYALAVFQILANPYGKYLGFFSLILALAHFLFGYAVFKLNPKDRILALVFVGMALLFITIAIPLQLDKEWFALAWAVEAVILTWIGLRNSATHLMATGMLVLGVSFIGMALSMFESGSFNASYLDEMSRRAMSFIPAIAATFCVAYLYFLLSKTQASMRFVSVLLVILANIFLLDYFSTEIYGLIGAYPALFGANIDTLQMTQLLSITVVWSFYSIALITLGIYRRVRYLRIAAIALLFMTIIKLYLVDLSSLDTIYRILAFIVLGLILVAISLVYQRHGAVLLGLVGVEKEE